MKTLLLGAALALTFGSASSAHAANTILFDPTGTGGAGMAVDTFDWRPDNGLGIGTFSVPFVGTSKTFQIVGQGILGSFIPPVGPAVSPAVGEFTFQVSFFETVVGVGTANTASVAAPGASSFTIFFHPVATADQLTGTGYAGGTTILTGTLAGLSGTFQDNTALFPTVFPVELLDQLGADNQNGTLTRQGSGSSTIQVDVGFADPNFFRSNITSLTVDLQDTSNNAVPFITANPSDQVLGFTPFYSLDGGQRINGANTAGLCTSGGQSEAGVNSTRCDLHLQTDASTSFNPTVVPEPGSLALLGAAFAAAGLGFRGARAGRSRLLGSKGTV